MSLKLIRRYQRKLLIGTAIIIIPTFVLLYGQNTGSGGGGPSGAAGTIGGETVSMDQFLRYARRHGASTGRKNFEPLLYNMAQLRAAEDAGMGASRYELRKGMERVVRIMLRKDSFTDAEYREVLDGRNMTPQGLQQAVREDIITDRYRQLIATGGQRSDADQYIDYVLNNLQVRVLYKDFPFSDYADRIDKPTDEEIQKYHEKQKDRKPRHKLALYGPEHATIEILFAEVEAFEKRVKMTEEELKKRYEITKFQYRIEEPEPEEPEKKTGEAGDDEKAEGNKADEKKDPDEKAGDEKQGDAPKNGDDAQKKDPPEPKYRPFEEVREEVAKDLRKFKGVDLQYAALNDAKKKVKEMLDALIEKHKKDNENKEPDEARKKELVRSIDLKPVAEEFKLSYRKIEHGTAEEIKKDDAFPAFGSLATVASDAFSSNYRGRYNHDLGPVKHPGKGKLVFRVAEFEERKPWSLEEARPEIVKRLIRERGDKKSEEAARSFKKKLEKNEVDLATLSDTAMVGLSHQKARWVRPDRFATDREGRQWARLGGLHLGGPDPTDEKKPGWWVGVLVAAQNPEPKAFEQSKAQRASNPSWQARDSERTRYIAWRYLEFRAKYPTFAMKTDDQSKGR